MRLRFVWILIISAGFTACRKSEEITRDPGAKLSFSADSILFDTVFTSVGSSHRQIKIYNTNVKAINISNVQLGNGSDSPFSLIINGQALNEKSDLRLDGRDSISIYAQVTINPNSQLLPFIVEDSILFLTNGNRQSIPLIAYGQNANFVNNVSISTNQVWTNLLPYVIYKSVTVQENTTLTINPGARILFHGNSGMNIRGTLIAAGTKTDSIVFTSDRLEKIFNEEPGQWSGLHLFSTSKNSSINYSIIKNGIVGIIADSLSATDHPKLLLSNTVIKNMEVAGFVGYNTELDAINNLFFNCGQYLMYGVGGGKFNIKQNTFAGYNFNFPRKTAAVYFSDFRNSTQKGELNIGLVNNIIWGSLTEELMIDIKTSGGLIATIRNNLIKTTDQRYKDENILNKDPLFLNAELHNYELQNSSPVLNKGNDLSDDQYFYSILNKDFKNKPRVFPSELGCYENN